VSKHSKLRAFPPAHKRNPNPPPPARKNQPPKSPTPPRGRPTEPSESTTQLRCPTTKAPRCNPKKTVTASSNQVSAESSAITYCRPPCRADPSAASPTPRGFRWPLPPPPWCRARGQCPNGSSRPGRSAPPSAPHLRARWNLLGRALRRLTTPPRPPLSLRGFAPQLARSRRQRGESSCAFERGLRAGAGGGRLCVGAGRRHVGPNSGEGTALPPRVPCWESQRPRAVR
jgi:hypothetical protein